MKKSLLMRRPALNGRGEDEIDFIYAQIKITLFNFYYLIRADLKKRWKTMPHIYRRESITALRFLEDAFKNPAKYFSRAETDCAWRTRAINYANKQGLENIVDAFYIIESPKDIFMKSVKDAILSQKQLTTRKKRAIICNNIFRGNDGDQAKREQRQRGRSEHTCSG